MLMGRTYESGGDYPLEPHEGRHWLEWEYQDDEILAGPPSRWVVWFDTDGLPHALRTCDNHLLVGKDIAVRWGQHVLDEFKAHINHQFDAEEAERSYERWVRAVEREEIR